jgi:hypothetical protein
MQPPKTDGERIVCIIGILFGGLAFAYVLGNITAVVAALNPEAAQYVLHAHSSSVALLVMLCAVPVCVDDAVNFWLSPTQNMFCLSMFQLLCT